MKKFKFMAIVAITMGLATLISSCQSEELSSADEALANTAIDEAQASGISDEVISSADDYLVGIENVGYQAVQKFNAEGVELQKAAVLAGVTLTDSVIITVDRPGLNDFPKKICIDFGTKGVTLKRGNVVKGKIYILVSNKMSIAGSTRTITLVDFFVNDNRVIGKKIVTFKGYTNEQNPYWTVVASDTVTRADGKKIIWNSERTRTRTDNNQTPLIAWDDTYSIAGNSSGVNAKGVAYTMAIDATKPLIRVGGYKFFVQGAVLITTEKRTVLVDYGTGTRDDKATITVDGVTKEITLKK